jgi:hypothetical protein
MCTMRKALAVLGILAAGTFFAHGASASRPAIATAAGKPVSAPAGLHFPIDHVGAFRYDVVTAPGFSEDTATVNSGFGIVGGNVTFTAPPMTVLRDSPAGLVVSVAFNVASFSGTPALVVQSSTVSPR